MARLGIVTVLYNSESVLEEFFETLDNQTFRDFTLYVIDNASTDKSLELARRLAEKVSFPCVFFPEPKNWGIAKGNNIGIKAALGDKCEYIMLSNNDVALVNNDTLEVMVDRMDTSDIDILCPKIYYYSDPKVIWAAGGTYVKIDTMTSHYGRMEEDNGNYDVEKEIRYTPTCFVIIRPEVFEKIGIMDEQYFVYYDDTDFMYRAWKAGLKIVYSPVTYILHNESISTGSGSPFKHYYLARNQFIFVRKNRPKWCFWGVVAYRFAAFALRHVWTNEKKQWTAELRGLRDGLKSN